MKTQAVANHSQFASSPQDLARLVVASDVAVCGQTVKFGQTVKLSAITVESIIRSGSMAAITVDVITLGKPMTEITVNPSAITKM